MSKKLFLICPKVWNSIKNQVNVNAWREKDGILKCMKAGRRALYEYGPYGSAVKMEGNAAELNPFRFSSEYADDELGLVYYNYRYYNPKDGRWLSRDILGEMHTQNNYAFMKNHAIFRFDLLGMYEYDEETKRQTKQFEKMINDCLSKFQGSGQYKAHPAALMPQEFYNDYPEEIPPNCLAHAIGCQKPIGTTYDQAVKELADRKSTRLNSSHIH